LDLQCAEVRQRRWASVDSFVRSGIPIANAYGTKHRPN
jgi:hypothetical protein